MVGAPALQAAPALPIAPSVVLCSYGFQPFRESVFRSSLIASGSNQTVLSRSQFARHRPCSGYHNPQDSAGTHPNEGHPSALSGREREPAIPRCAALLRSVLDHAEWRRDRRSRSSNGSKPLLPWSFRTRATSGGARKYNRTIADHPSTPVRQLPCSRLLGNCPHQSSGSGGSGVPEFIYYQGLQHLLWGADEARVPADFRLDTPIGAT